MDFEIKQSILIEFNGDETCVNIPKHVKIIGESAFEGCENLRTVKMSKHMKTVGNRAFCDCKSLEGIIIPDSVNKIGSWALGLVKGFEKNEGFVIRGKKGSAAERYAEKWELTFVPNDNDK